VSLCVCVCVCVCVRERERERERETAKHGWRPGRKGCAEGRTEAWGLGEEMEWSYKHKHWKEKRLLEDRKSIHLPSVH
jgi:hypothetical protein